METNKTQTAALRFEEMPDGSLVLDAYHAGQHDDPRWFTTDRAHAAYFGKPALYRLTLSSFKRIDVRGDARFEMGGDEADRALYALLDEECVAGLVLDGWEGRGLTILIAEDGADLETL